MSQVVLSDGQWTMFRYLRPFPNFERVYQNQPGNTPIAFPGVLDLFAEKKVVGYDPNLLGAITVPLGARVTIWIPQTLAQPGDSDPVVNALYQYQILWRNRTTRDFRVGQAEGIGNAQQSYSGFHLPTSGLGQPQFVNSPPSAADQRIFLPGALRTVAFEQTEPVGTVPSVIHLRGEYLQPVGDPVWIPPLTPQGNAALWQQGAYVDSAATNGSAGGPAYFTFTTDAEGDEMTILASKIDPSTNWNFSIAAPGDGSFSNTYGTNNGQNPPSQYGILVTTGTS
jgi:hypothetical protein